MERAENAENGSEDGTQCILIYIQALKREVSGIPIQYHHASSKAEDEASVDKSELIQYHYPGSWAEASEMLIRIT